VRNGNLADRRRGRAIALTFESDRSVARGQPSVDLPSRSIFFPPGGAIVSRRQRRSPLIGTRIVKSGAAGGGGAGGGEKALALFLTRRANEINVAA